MSENFQRGKKIIEMSKFKIKLGNENKIKSLGKNQKSKKVQNYKKICKNSKIILWKKNGNSEKFMKIHRYSTKKNVSEN